MFCHFAAGLLLPLRLPLSLSCPSESSSWGLGLSSASASILDTPPGPLRTAQCSKVGLARDLQVAVGNGYRSRDSYTMAGESTIDNSKRYF